jgi:DNA-3-methyladenine glycosylase I
VSGAVVVGDDGQARCPWGGGAGAGARVDLLMRDYHDHEWGVAIHDETGLYERVCLEGFQSGLSWRTILAKRPAFRSAFHDFDPDVVAGFGARDVTRLLGDAGIVRSRAKIEAAIANARATVALRDGGGLAELIWSHRPARTPRAPRSTGDLHTQTPESVALAKALRSHGFRFVGPTTMYALMEAVGLVNDHLQRCAFR